uniref:PNL9_p5 n=1 Tax=Neisseria lactamica TaxID=486 RepID=Q0QVY0_NEILA|nr:pNL9_p5 [Neisseria lactamica]
MMGYRVGLQCFSKKEQAEDYSVSQIVPVISPDGKLYAPYKSGGNWYIGRLSDRFVFSAMLPRITVCTRGNACLFVPDFIRARMGI